MSNTVRITVIKKTLNEDVFKYSTEAQNVKPCAWFEVGDTFICTTNELPNGFCAWAFGDIQKDFALIAYDATKEKKKVTCCTSALHNVYFQLESI